MKELLVNVDFKSVYWLFLKERANDWIKHAKIKDKCSHFEALKEYLYN